MTAFREKISREKIFNILKLWVPLTAVLTLVTGLAYLLVQQSIRLEANYPQVQIAEDIAEQLKTGNVSTDFMNLKTVEISQSLSPWAIIYTDSGQSLGSSGLLDGLAPSVPAGILDYTRLNGVDRVTWQPRKGVRQALVAIHFKGDRSGFVVAGKSLRDTEEVIDNITLVTFVGWVTVVITGLIIVAAFQFIF